MNLWKACGPVLLSVVLLHTASGAAARVTEIAVKDRANAFASIVANGTFAAVAWGATKDGVTDIYAAVSREGGRNLPLPRELMGPAAPRTSPGTAAAGCTRPAR
jgi:hypothetical protein